VVEVVQVVLGHLVLNHLLHLILELQVVLVGILFFHHLLMEPQVQSLVIDILPVVEVLVVVFVLILRMQLLRADQVDLAAAAQEVRHHLHPQVGVLDSQVLLILAVAAEVLDLRLVMVDQES
jgi:hypothetical protein